MTVQGTRAELAPSKTRRDKARERNKVYAKKRWAERGNLTVAQMGELRKEKVTEAMERKMEKRLDNLIDSDYIANCSEDVSLTGTDDENE